MRFRHERIDARPPCGRLSWCLTTDLTGNGRPDVVVGAQGRYPVVDAGGRELKLRLLPGVDRLLPRFETNLFWYENPGWERHTLATERDLELDVGAALHDVDGDGRLDLLVGQGHDHTDVYWYRQPEDPRDPWEQHLLTDSFRKYHDLAVGDVDDDGEPEVVGLSQEAEAVFYYDVPDDPTVEPWPDSHCHVVDEGHRVEGVHVGDVDGDGETELVAGTNIYHRNGDGWRRETVVEGWDDVRVAVADLDGDGEDEIVLAEGDSPIYGTHPAQLAWFDGPDWTPHLLRDDLYCPHSLQIGDVTGNGHPDIYVAEMGLRENDDPVHLLFENRGDGEFEEHVVARGIPTHEAKLVDMDGDGRLDVVGKSYGPAHHVDVWYNEAD
ncbi:FG-GAP repeat domain-containing protein [Halomarina ordinaria]|uniref:FG-GAP repeat domain-containing protein n=1 Tax=Halomarina ordinaria TaxID=3033939 RepID=A0ABD5UH19_9EURY|nr:VCBS repeat-containing protein [Halomarina sp. PSRA2]